MSIDAKETLEIMKGTLARTFGRAVNIVTNKSESPALMVPQDKYEKDTQPFGELFSMLRDEKYRETLIGLVAEEIIQGPDLLADWNRFIEAGEVLNGPDEMAAYETAIDCMHVLDQRRKEIISLFKPGTKPN